MDLISGEAETEIYLMEGLIDCTDTAYDPGTILNFLSYILCAVRNQPKNDTHV
jgi:hypothetical protein